MTTVTPINLFLDPRNVLKLFGRVAAIERGGYPL